MLCNAQVVSADSIIIRGQPAGGPPPEKQINLAWVQAPKISKRLPPSDINPKGSNTIDEPYAWEGREFLRKKLIGKQIQFKVEYKVPFGSQQRECGVVYLDGENLIETLVSAGYVDVIKRKQNTENPEFQHLVELEEAAIAAGRGKHSGAACQKREILYEVEEPDKLVGKSFDGIVEHVISGSTLRVALEVKKNSFQQATIMLSGIVCPRNPEPYSEEARFFTESRILQKDVKVRIEQVSTGGKNSSSSNSSPFLVASVICNKHNIAEHLLREGYAKCIDRTLAIAITPDKLRAAETEAKSNKLRLWKNYEQKVKADTETWVGTVIEVINADALMVENNATKEVKKLFLASVRPPPRPEGGEKVTRVLYDVPFMFEAREFLRTRLIGKQVNVHIDYIQPKSDAYPEKTCASIFTLDGNVNVGEALIAKGLATAVRYRQDDDQRSAHYDALREAEVKAQNAKRGLHGNPEKGIVRIVDISSDAQKAKQFLPSLQRSSINSRREAIVEHVFSASRVKVYIPKDNCCFNLILGGVMTPKASDPFGAESTQFVKSLLHQRTVQVVVDNMDKVGNFIGTIFFEGKNLSLELVKAGYASVRDERGADFRAAEDTAKQNRLNIWKDWKEEVVEADKENEGDDVPETNGETNGTEKKEDRIPVVVTQVADDLSHFYAQSVENGPAFASLLEEMRKELASHPPLPGAYSPKKGEIVAAKFTADGLWYRARVEKLVDKKVEVTYVDYGNKEILPVKRLATLPAPKFNVTVFPEAITKYSLAFVCLPDDKEVVDETRALFEKEVFSRDHLLLRIEYKDTASNVDAVTLYDPTTKKDIVLKLVEEGLLLLNRKERRRERRLQKTLAEYRAAQDNAKKNRVSLSGRWFLLYVKLTCEILISCSSVELVAVRGLH
jgi:staphylococcal nuclease domain-containing protein 1